MRNPDRHRRLAEQGFLSPRGRDVCLRPVRRCVAVHGALCGTALTRPRLPFQGHARRRDAHGDELRMARRADSRDVFRAVSENERQARPVRGVRAGDGLRRGQRRRDGGVHQADDGCIGEGASARPALPPRSRGTRRERVAGWWRPRFRARSGSAGGLEALEEGEQSVVDRHATTRGRRSDFGPHRFNRGQISDI